MIKNNYGELTNADFFYEEDKEGGKFVHVQTKLNKKTREIATVIHCQPIFRLRFS